MSASIRIETGISAGTSYWIDRPVLRIGSDPQCEICLPSAELAPHALTLEFRAGEYCVYNRGAAPLVVDGATVEAGGKGMWRGDTSLELSGAVRLRLAIDGDPRPCPRPESRDERDDYLENSSISAVVPNSKADDVAKGPSKALVQMGVIGLCVLGTMAFLMVGRGGEAASQDRPTFESIVATSLASDEAASRADLQRLQYAQAALVRGHHEHARERFLDLRDRLVRQIEATPDEGQAGAERMLNYVEYRLGQLE